MSDLIRWFDNRRSPIEMIERLFEGDVAASGIRVEQLVEGTTLVVRAELPGIDPEKDVEITLGDGFLEIRAERQEKEEQKDEGSYRTEFRYGSFVRRLPVPDTIQKDDVSASYKDGVLEVRAPIPERVQPSSAHKIPITRE